MAMPAEDIAPAVAEPDSDLVERPQASHSSDPQSEPEFFRAPAQAGALDTSRHADEPPASTGAQDYPEPRPSRFIRRI